MSCGGFAKKYFQQLVIVNRKDVLSYVIQTVRNISPTESECRHRVYFKLKENKRGFRFSAPEKGNNFLGSFSKSKDNGRSEYSHRVQILLMGAGEQLKCLLRDLDGGSYFVALQLMDGTIEIYGFEYGLTTSDYTYDLASGLGGSLIELISDPDALEDEPPFIYKSMGGSENDDFNNDFDSNPPIILGDFNEDFSNDFYKLAT